MPDDARDHEDPNIPTNMRLLLLLEELGRAGVPITPTEANSAIGLPKPTLHRLFRTLEDEGLVQRDIDGRSFSPGRRLRSLSVNVLSSLRARTARLAVLRKLSEEVGETCNIAAPEREGMTYVDRVESKWPLRIQLPTGSSVPFHCTAGGKLYLSSLQPTHLDRFLASTELEKWTPSTITDPGLMNDEIVMIRERGYSTDNEEFMEDMVAIAVPIKDRRGRLMSTLAIHGPIQRFTLDIAEGHLDRMHETARDLASLAIETEG